MNRIVAGICGLGAGILLGLLIAGLGQRPSSEISAERDRLLKENTSLATQLAYTKISKAPQTKASPESVYSQYFGPAEKSPDGRKIEAWSKHLKDLSEMQAIQLFANISSTARGIELRADKN